MQNVFWISRHSVWVLHLTSTDGLSRQLFRELWSWMQKTKVFPGVCVCVCVCVWARVGDPGTVLRCWHDMTHVPTYLHSQWCGTTELQYGRDIYMMHNRLCNTIIHLLFVCVHCESFRLVIEYKDVFLLYFVSMFLFPCFPPKFVYSFSTHIHTLRESCTHARTHAHTHTHTQTYTWLSPLMSCVFVIVCVTERQTDRQTHKHIHTRSLTYRGVHIPVRGQIQTQTMKRIHISRFKHAHAHAHTHTHLSS